MLHTMPCGHYRLLALPEDCPHFRIHPHEHCLLQGQYPTLFQVGPLKIVHHTKPCLDYRCQSSNPSYTVHLRQTLYDGIVEVINVVFGARFGYYSVGYRYHDLPWHTRFTDAVTPFERFYGLLALFCPLSPDLQGGENKCMILANQSEKYAAYALRAYQADDLAKAVVGLRRFLEKTAMFMWLQNKAKQSYFALEKQLTRLTPVRARIEKVLRDSRRESEVEQQQGPTETDNDDQHNTTTDGDAVISDGVEGTSVYPAEASSRTAVTDVLRYIPNLPEFADLRARDLHLGTLNGPQAAVVLLCAWLGTLSPPGLAFLDGRVLLYIAIEMSWREFMLKYGIDERCLQKRPTGSVAEENGNDVDKGGNENSGGGVPLPRTDGEMEEAR